jgi:hypothetical protein
MEDSGQISVVKMVMHKEAGKVLADAFEVYEGEWEWTAFFSGLFGKEATFFGGLGLGTEARSRGQRSRGVENFV